ncbi:MAG: GNAT family N-acetyltransferase [Cohaesibacter sp.]|nr:GNAT family N-acetyltransferase [Cohaesibacter sp.]
MMIATTDRLILRQIEESDADFLLALMNEPAYHAMIGDRGLRAPDDARLYCRDILRTSYQKHGFGLYLVCLKDGDRTPVGFCGLLKRDWLEDVDIGYAIQSRYWRRGYAFEACQMVLSHAVDDLKLKNVMAITSIENEASMSLLLKLGFHRQDQMLHPDSGDMLDVLHKRLV